MYSKTAVNEVEVYNIYKKSVEKKKVDCVAEIKTCKTCVSLKSLQIMKNLDILSLKLFFRIVALLKKAKKDVCSFICFALMIVNPRIVPRKFLGLLYLT